MLPFLLIAFFLAVFIYFLFNDDKKIIKYE